MLQPKLRQIESHFRVGHTYTKSHIQKHIHTEISVVSYDKWCTFPSLPQHCTVIINVVLQKIHLAGQVLLFCLFFFFQNCLDVFSFLPSCLNFKIILSTDTHTLTHTHICRYKMVGIFIEIKCSALHLVFLH